MAATDSRKAAADGGDPVAVPSRLLNMNVQAFVKRTYDMVDDSSTDGIVSWGPMNNSFIVKDKQEFERDLLPKFFKHNNYESFIRQLNSYGFQKVDRDWLEFANKGFSRDQRHLLSSIVRRKPARGKNQQPQHAHGQSSRVETCAEVGKFVLEEEVERLKRDKNVLKQEFAKLKNRQQTTDTQLQSMVQRLHGMEQRRPEMMTLLSKAVNNPDFAPAIDSLAPDSKIFWDSSSIDEILKSIDPSGGQFPVPSPLATDAEEMDSTPPSAP